MTETAELAEIRSGRLVGKVALISGAARGMGASHARAMTAEGARVVLGDVLDSEGERLATELGDAAAYVHLDVTDAGQWEEAVATALQRFGQLNVLVNNAGIVNGASFDRYPRSDWDAIVAVNLTGVFNGMSAAVETLKLGAPSSVINVSSTAGLKGYARLPGYTATKFGVRGLTKAAALDLGRYGIRVNSVHPGSVATPMTEGLDIPVSNFAMGRIGQPHELSSLVVFLASDESSYCSGAEFVADGGELAGIARNLAGIARNEEGQ